MGQRPRPRAESAGHPGALHRDRDLPGQRPELHDQPGVGARHHPGSQLGRACPSASPFPRLPATPPSRCSSPAPRARKLGADRPAYPDPVSRRLVQRHADQLGIPRSRGRSRRSTWTCPRVSVTSTCRSTRRTTPPTTRCTTTCSRPADLAPAVTESGNIEVTATDTSPTPDNPTGNASLIAPDPAARSVGDRRDAGRHDRRDGVLPDRHRGRSPTTSSSPSPRPVSRRRRRRPSTPASSVPVTVTVTNTTNHVGYFELHPSGNDISGGNATTPVELAAGADRDADGDAVAHGGRGHRGKRHPQRHRLDRLGRRSSPPSGSRRPSPTSTISPTPTRSGASPGG